MSIASNTRIDPYKNFKFRLVWEGRPAYGSNQLRGTIPSAAVQFRSGGDPSTAHKSPGRNKYETITLERGVTQDALFHNWASQVSKFGSNPGAEASLANFRKDIFLELYNEAGQLTASYKLLRAWISKYKALPALGGLNNAVAIEHIEIEYEGIAIALAPRTGPR